MENFGVKSPMLDVHINVFNSHFHPANLLHVQRNCTKKQFNYVGWLKKPQNLFFTVFESVSNQKCIQYLRVTKLSLRAWSNEIKDQFKRVAIKARWVHILKSSEYLNRLYKTADPSKLLKIS